MPEPYEIKFRTTAEGTGAKEVARDLENINTQTKAWVFSKKNLIAQFKALKAEAHGLPLIGTAIRLLRNPLTILAAGLAALINQVRKTREELKQLEEDAKLEAPDMLATNMDALTASMERFRKATREGMDELKDAFELQLREIEKQEQATERLIRAHEDLAVAKAELAGGDVMAVRERFAALRAREPRARVAAIERQIQSLEVGGFGAPSITELAAQMDEDMPAIRDALAKAEAMQRRRKEVLEEYNKLLTAPIKGEIVPTIGPPGVLPPTELIRRDEQARKERQAKLDALLAESTALGHGIGMTLRRVQREVPGVANIADLDRLLAERRQAAAQEYTRRAREIIGLRREREAVLAEAEVRKQTETAQLAKSVADELRQANKTIDAAMRDMATGTLEQARAIAETVAKEMARVSALEAKLRQLESRLNALPPQ